MLRNLADAKTKICNGRGEYNRGRPHASLGHYPPNQFADTSEAGQGQGVRTQRCNNCSNNESRAIGPRTSRPFEFSWTLFLEGLSTTPDGGNPSVEVFDAIQVR